MKLDVISLPVRQGLLVRLPSDDSTIRSDDSDSRRRSSIFFSHSAQAPQLFVSLPGFQRFDDGRLLLLLFAFQLSCVKEFAPLFFFPQTIQLFSKHFFRSSISCWVGSSRFLRWASWRC